MRLLVTGGAGFIGSNFIRYWLSQHPRDEIVNIDLLTYAGDLASLADVEREQDDGYRFVRADIADAVGMRETIRAVRPAMIVNFAAETHNSRAIVDPGAFVRTNVVGTQALLEAARHVGVERIHHVSTCEVYGDLPLESTEAFTETSPYRPGTPYNASKAAADLIARSYYRTYGTPVTISLSCNTYGPWQHPEKLIPLFTTNALEDRPIPIYRSSSHRREWLHVADHCRAIEAILLRGRTGEMYNVGSGDERSVDEIADAILLALGKPAELKTYVSDRPAHERRYPLDHTKITEELGWRPAIRFARGLGSTIAWYAQNRAWWGPKKLDLLDEAAWAAERGAAT